MGSLEAYYLLDRDEPIIIPTPDDVEPLIDRVRSESPPQAPIMINMFLVDDPYSQTLGVGVSNGRGILRYAGEDAPGGVVSTNGNPRDDGELPYFYMGNWQPYPVNSEISLRLVQDAVKEFMTSGGARPTCIDWQPGLI